jgi:glycosyltransferase involved in cell wall biosynthesis
MEQEKINCTVAILTFNSEAGLRTCLSSVKEFAEIIIADGGSTDATLSIAREYGAKIISQSNPGFPITDFSKERQRTLDASTCPWFFYLDSDEVMTPELKDEIRRITKLPTLPYKVYKVRYELSTPDFSRKYVSYKPYFQTRFFHKESGAYFIKKVHEKIAFPKGESVGVITASWLVPLNEQLAFSVYKNKVHKRLKILADEWNERNFFVFIKRGLLPQLISLLKQLYKMVVLRCREQSKNVVPFRYEVYRLYSPVVLSIFLTFRYVRLICNK